MTATTRRGFRIGTATVVWVVLLGTAGCGGDGEPANTAVVSVPTETDTTDLGEYEAVAELEASAAAGAACRAPGPLPGGASDALAGLHSAASDLAGSADAVRALAGSGGAPASWPDDPGDSLTLRRFLEDLYRVVERAARLSSDPAAEALLTEPVQAVLILQAGDLPSLYRAGSAQEASGPADAICAVVDLFANAIDAIGAAGTPSTSTTVVPTTTTTSSSTSTTAAP